MAAALEDFIAASGDRVGTPHLAQLVERCSPKGSASHSLGSASEPGSGPGSKQAPTMSLPGKPNSLTPALGLIVPPKNLGTPVRGLNTPLRSLNTPARGLSTPSSSPVRARGAPTMTSCTLGNLVINVNTAENPTDDEWNEYLALCEQHKLNFRGQMLFGLTVTDGATPSAAQRNRFRAVLENTSITGAMLTDSLVARGLVTVLSMFVSGLAAFSSAEWQAMFTHLKIPPERQREVRAELARMSARVGGVRVLEPLLSVKG